MRGALLIERENSDGDRRILASYDAEDRDGFDNAIEHARREARDVVAFRVRVVHDRPERDPQLRTLFRVDEFGREKTWQP